MRPLLRVAQMTFVTPPWFTRTKIAFDEQNYITETFKLPYLCFSGRKFFECPIWRSLMCGIRIFHHFFPFFSPFQYEMTSIPPKNPNFIIESIIFARTRNKKGSKCYRYRSPNGKEENIKKIEIFLDFFFGYGVINDVISP